MGNLARYGIHVSPTTRWQRFLLFFVRGHLVPLGFPSAKHGWAVCKTLGRRVFIVGVKGPR